MSGCPASGLDTAARILADAPDQRIVLFTAFRDATLETAAAKLRIRACISKSEFHRLLSRLHAAYMSDNAVPGRDGQKSLELLQTEDSLQAEGG